PRSGRAAGGREDRAVPGTSARGGRQGDRRRGVAGALEDTHRAADLPGAGPRPPVAENPLPVAEKPLPVAEKPSQVAERLVRGDGSSAAWIFGAHSVTVEGMPG